MLNWRMRYQAAVAVLAEADAGTVLDVGSGWHGIGHYRAGRAVHTDLDFPDSARAAGAVGDALYVASTAEQLPFADGAFDFAVSLDMFEHLPVGIRKPSIEELCRVARRGVIAGFPVGSAARRVDAVLYAAFRAFRRDPPNWLVEHRAQERYPDRKMLAEALPEGWEIAREIRSGNVIVQVLVVLGEHTPWISGLLSRLDSRWSRHSAPRWIDWRPTYRTIYCLTPTDVTRGAA